jgi:TonB family C-terminal domain
MLVVNKRKNLMKKIILLVILFLSISFTTLSASHANNNDMNLSINGISTLPPCILNRVDPVYPLEAINYHLAGRVRLKIIISKSGSFKSVIRESSGYQILDNAALEAIRQWKFLPAQDKRGQPVDSSILIPITFGSPNDTYFLVKSIIDHWDPMELEPYIHPNAYNEHVDKIFEQVKELDSNNINNSLDKLVTDIEMVDANKKYNMKVYKSVARKIIKVLFSINDSSKQWILMASGCGINFKEAIPYYDKAIELELYDADYYSKRAFAYYFLSNYQNAVFDYSNAIELEPKNDKYYNMRGINYYYLKDYQNAIKDHNKAIEIKPENDEYYYERGQAYYKIKKYQNAIGDYNTAIKIKNTDPRYYLERGRVYHALEKYQNAIDDYNKSAEIISFYSDFSSICFHRGETYLALHDYKKALNDFNKAIATAPNIADYYNGRGNVYYQLKDYQKAINDYTKSITILSNNAKYNKDKAKYLINRSAVYQQIGEIQKADDDKKEAKILDKEQGQEG